MPAHIRYRLVLSLPVQHLSDSVLISPANDLEFFSIIAGGLDRITLCSTHTSRQSVAPGGDPGEPLGARAS